VRDAPSGLDVLQGFERQAVPLFFLFDPGRQSLLDDPAARAVQPLGQCIDLVGEGRGDMSGQDAGIGRRHAIDSE